VINIVKFKKCLAVINIVKFKKCLAVINIVKLKKGYINLFVYTLYVSTLSVIC